jgi:hypothetical protein
MRILKFTLAMFCLVALNAMAAPGYTVTSFKVDAMKGEAVVAALDEWMASDAGKEYKGRLLLQAHTQDGLNPATHSIVGIYSSMTEAEAFGNHVVGNEEALAAWMTMISKISPITEQTFTGRYARLAGWGDMSDKDRIWIQHSLTTQDAASTYRAFDAWMTSKAGQKFPGQLHLLQTIAAGLGGGSHVVNIGFESLAEMEKWNEMTAASAELTQLLHTFSVVNEYHGANLATDVKAWGKSLKSVIK